MGVATYFTSEQLVFRLPVLAVGRATINAITVVGKNDKYHDELVGMHRMCYTK